MTPQMMLELAVNLHLHGDYAGARTHCERALALSPPVPETLTSDLLDVLGSAQRDAGDLQSARISYGRALEIRRRLFGYESAQVATTLSNLGVLEHRAGRNDEAIALLGPAVLLLSEKHGELHPEVARAGVNLGIAHAAAGNLDRARTIFQLAVNAFNASLGENHPDLGRAIDGLATVCLLSGDRNEACRFFAQALRILSATVGPDHPQTAACRAKLTQAERMGEASERATVTEQTAGSSIEAAFERGAALEISGDLEHARREFIVCISSADPEWAPRAAFALGMLMRKLDPSAASPTLRRAIDSGHPRWAALAAANLALLLTETNDVAGACDAYRIAIRSGQPDIAPQSATNLGILLAGQGDTAGACEAYRVAIASGHPDEAPRSAVNLGFLLSDSDRRAAVDAFELAIRSGHPEQTPMAQLNLAGLSLKSGDEAAARHLLEAAIASRHPVWAARCEEVVRKLDEAHDLASQLALLGEEWVRHEEYEQAIPVLARSIALYRPLADRNRGPFELLMVAPLNNHGFCLLKLRRFQEALSSFEEAVAVADRHMSEDPRLIEPLIANALMSIAAILGELGEFDRAMGITERLVGLRRAHITPGALPVDPELAKALRVFALIRGWAGIDLERALSAAREATSLYGRLAQHAPDDFGRELEVAYAALAGLLERLGRDEEALRIRDSTGVRRVPWKR